jgi:predicted transcriptional regulator
MGEVINFPLRGRRLAGAITQAVNAAGRPVLTSEVAEIVGMNPAVVLAELLHLQSCGIVRSREAPDAA